MFSLKKLQIWLKADVLSEKNKWISFTSGVRFVCLSTYARNKKNHTHTNTVRKIFLRILRASKKRHYSLKPTVHCQRNQSQNNYSIGHFPSSLFAYRHCINAWKNLEKLYHYECIQTYNFRKSIVTHNGCHAVCSTRTWS